MTTTAIHPAETEAATGLLLAAGLTEDQTAQLVGESEEDGVRFLALFAECNPSADVLARLRPVLKRLAG